jgi:hypothetical protein
VIPAHAKTFQSSSDPTNNIQPCFGIGIASIAIFLLMLLKTKASCRLSSSVLSEIGRRDISCKRKIINIIRCIRALQNNSLTDSLIPERLDSAFAEKSVFFSAFAEN